jgi:osmotically-inducible protein OsmY
MTLNKHRAHAARWMTRLALAAAAGSLLSACAPLVLGGAVGGAFMATDRRTSGTQVEDKGIEIKAASRIRSALGERGHVSVNSYNRVVLLTGEVASDSDKQAAEQATSQTENVKSVVNELAVMGNSSLTSRSNDVLLQTKVKATLVDARDVMSNAFKVVVERGDVFLMGMVTEREANRVAELVSTVGGVQKVVKVLHIISEDELAQKTPKGPAPAASEPSEQR